MSARALAAAATAQLRPVGTASAQLYHSVIFKEVLGHVKVKHDILLGRDIYCVTRTSFVHYWHVPFLEHSNIYFLQELQELQEVQELQEIYL